MKLTLVQKVLVSVIILFLAASAVFSYVVASQIDQAYLGEQKRNVAEFVRKQADQHLAVSDFQANDSTAILPRFVAYQNEIVTPEIVRIKIYNTKGIVLYSDQTELIGQDLFADDPAELKEILGGNVVADIAKPDKKENIYEQQYGQLLEIYTPISFADSKIVGIVEVYYRLDLLNSEIRQSQLFFIGSIAGIFGVLFAILFFIVQRASRTLIDQDKQLQEDIKKEKEYSLLKDDFIRLASHQLRTPATAIKWSVEELKEEGLDKFNDSQKKSLEAVNISNETLIGIVNNLLVVSDIKPDYFSSEKESYDLADLVRKVLKTAEKKVEEKKLQVEFSPPAGLPKINLRKDALEKVIANLVSNAVDYTPAGGEIKMVISQKDTSLTLEISDTGIGIPEEEKDKVFSEFFRAKNAVEQKNVGSGLGLYICKRIIEGYGGTIKYESGIKGTKMTVTIPGRVPGS